MLVLMRGGGSYAVYIKSAEEIEHLLKLIGAKRSVAEIEEARAVKLVKERCEPSRERRARQPDQKRPVLPNISLRLSMSSSSAAFAMRFRMPWRSFATCASRYPDLSLRDLGEMADPPLSKSALYHRVLRLEKLIEANG